MAVLTALDLAFQEEIPVVSPATRQDHQALLLLSTVHRLLQSRPWRQACVLARLLHLHHRILAGQVEL